MLLKRMEDELPRALEQMREHGKKVGHWAWWAFPTELQGQSEPGFPTNVTKGTAAEVLARAPKVWRQTLECVCELAKKKGKRVLPSIDHGRVSFFVRFWAEVDESPPWMRKVLRVLKPIYGG